MDRFEQSEERRHEKQLEALVATAMENNPASSLEAAAAFESAVAALRHEGQAAADFMLAMASRDVPVPQVHCLWLAIYEMGDSVAPGVDHVMRTGVQSARLQAVMTLCAFAEESPEIKDACVASLRDAAASPDHESVRKIATVCLSRLSEKGII